MSAAGWWMSPARTTERTLTKSLIPWSTVLYRTVVTGIEKAYVALLRNPRFSSRVHKSPSLDLTRVYLSLIHSLILYLWATLLCFIPSLSSFSKFGLIHLTFPVKMCMNFLSDMHYIARPFHPLWFYQRNIRWEILNSCCVIYVHSCYLPSPKDQQSLQCCVSSFKHFHCSI